MTVVLEINVSYLILSYLIIMYHGEYNEKMTQYGELGCIF